MLSLHLHFVLIISQERSLEWNYLKFLINLVKLLSSKTMAIYVFLWVISGNLMTPMPELKIVLRKNNKERNQCQCGEVKNNCYYCFICIFLITSRVTFHFAIGHLCSFSLSFKFLCPFPSSMIFLIIWKWSCIKDVNSHTFIAKTF